MRVAFLVDRFPATSETFITTQIAGVLRAGCEVTVIARRRPRIDEPEHDEVRALDVTRRTTYLDRSLTVDALDPVHEVPLAPGRHDVLHAQFGSNAHRFLFARAQAAAPLVVTFHGYDWSADPRMHGADMYEALFEVADVVTYNSEHARRALESLGCPPEKLHRVRMPIDVSLFPFRERRWEGRGRLRFVTVARLVEKKGHELALRALASARDRLPDFHYDIVGDGPLAEHLEHVVTALGLDEVVSMHGAGASFLVRALLEDAHVFLLASATAADGDEEGTPVSLMEAQACGLAVVSTLNGGIPEVVDGAAGILVPEGDPEAFADALVEVARAHDSWPVLGAAGRAHVEATYDVPVCTGQLLDAYRAAASSYGRSAALR